MPEVDNLLWLKAAGTPEAYNSLGIIYILGRNVQQDKEKSLEYFRKANNDMAFFNIASLSACGLFPGGRAFVERYLDKISDLNGLLQSSSSSKQIDINDSMTLILENINNTASSETLIFLDTETAGLPLREDAPASDSANWPRLVQISWIVSDMAGNKLSTSSYIIKPNGFNIPQDAMQIHGISTDTARRFGKDLSSILNKFLHDTNCAKKIIGHNIDFDINVVAAELYRTGIKDSLSTIDRICTMKSTINYCQLGGGPDFKYPKLEELYFKLFGRHILSAHNASSDVEATFKCYWELKQQHIIQ